jgi:ABC-type transport system involved in cytochrome c biogenesis permease subunit
VLLLMMDLLPIVTGDPSNSGFDSRIKSFNALVPVLKDHFWLAVHVLTITLSYGAFALAWLLAHVTLGRVLVRPTRDETGDELLQYVYSVLKAGVFLLAVGTILGAFWGHYAWGRFWGWDSKETWSLITLLAYVFVLHMRFTGYWNDIAFAVGAVVCFLSVVMAWYGVNFILGSGLHSYGTGSGGLLYVGLLVLIDLLFVGASLTRRAMSRPAGRTG